ncbi:MAG: PAS domain S-box protein [Gammaproteobacteria bacterium]|nr:PAS domain S-box protein [Gammaproteobacteria bacterium]
MSTQEKEKNEQAMQYLDIVDTIIVALDLSGNITFINKAGCELLGYGKHALLGQNWFDQFIPGDIREAVKAKFKSRLDGHTNLYASYESVLITRKSEEKLIAWHNNAIHDDTANIIGMLFSGDDVTQKIRDREKLASSEARWRSILEATQDHIMVLDREGIIYYINHAAPGLKKEDVIKTSVYQYVDETAHKAMESCFKHVFDTGENGEYSVSYQDSEGCDHFYQSTVSPMIEGGKVTSVIVSARDVTAMKKTDSDLILLQDQLNHALQNQLDRVLTLSTSVIYTRKMSEHYALTFMGEGIQSQLGYSPADFTDDPDFWVNHIHPDDKQRVLQELSSFDDHEEHIQEYRFRHKNGNYLWMHDEFRVSHDTNNKPRELIGAWVDITRNKIYEENLKQAKLNSDAANKAKSTFLAVIGHELRTPLNVVLGMSNILLKGELTNQQREDVATILTAASELQRIIEDIVDYVKLESGGIRLKDDVFAVRDTIARIAGRFRPLAEKKNLKFDVTVSSKVPRLCVGDEGRIIQVLNNIIGNAIKFTNQGGIDIKVDVAIVTKTTLELMVTVQDTGIGIERDQYRLIFNKFIQVDDSRSRSHGGIGLGLSIARELVEMMDGGIKLNSILGQGSTFTIHLGLKLPKENSAYKEGGNKLLPIGYSRLKVLLVEDDQQQQILLQEIIEKLGCRVVVAWGGKEALSLFDSDYDIVFTDVTMPGMDGYELSQRLRQRMMAYDKPIPIVGVTAICQEDDEVIRESELDACVSKPTDSKAIEEIFAAYISHDDIEAIPKIH